MKVNYKDESPKSFVEFQFAIATGKGLEISGYAIWTKGIANKVNEGISVKLNSPFTTFFWV